MDLLRKTGLSCLFGIVSNLLFQITREMTVLSFKRRIEGKVGCSSSRHRLIYRGRLLTDDRETLASCGVLDGHTIHFVKGGPSAPATSPSPPAASPALSPAFPPPDALRGMMESPMMQSMMQNPDIMRNLVESNPQLRALADAHPELRHALSDPDLMRQAMQSARDPYGILRLHCHLSAFKGLSDPLLLCLASVYSSHAPAAAQPGARDQPVGEPSGWFPAPPPHV